MPHRPVPGVRSFATTCTTSLNGVAVVISIFCPAGRIWTIDGHRPRMLWRSRIFCSSSCSLTRSGCFQPSSAADPGWTQTREGTSNNPPRKQVCETRVIGLMSEPKNERGTLSDTRSQTGAWEQGAKRPCEIRPGDSPRHLARVKRRNLALNVLSHHRIDGGYARMSCTTCPCTSVRR